VEGTKILILSLFLAVLAVVIYDEAAGGRTLSRTLAGGEGGVDFTPLQENWRVVTALALVLLGLYIISDKLAIAAGAVILVSTLLIRR